MAQSDFNRDGRVNAVDLAIVRSNQGRSLALFTAPAAATPAAATLAGSVPPPSAARTGAGPRRRGVWDDPPPELLV